jgi:hypothetical protein
LWLPHMCGVSELASESLEISGITALPATTLYSGRQTCVFAVPDR